MSISTDEWENKKILDMSMNMSPATSKDDILREIQTINELLKIMINKMDELIQLNKRR